MRSKSIVLCHRSAGHLCSWCRDSAMLSPPLWLDHPMWQFYHLQHTTKQTRRDVEAIFGCCATAKTVSPPWSPDNCNASVRSKRRPSGAASFRKRCPKDCCAAVFKSATVPDCKTQRLSRRPLGKATSSRIELPATWLLPGLLSIARLQRGGWTESMVQA